MSFIIILNLILLGIDTPIKEPSNVISYLNIIFTIIFILEIMLRILAYGFIWNI